MRNHSDNYDHHSHNHHHHEHYVPKNYNRAFGVGIGLNFTFVVVEAFYGYLSNSLALMADAGHNLSDVAGLVLAWGAFWLASKKPSSQYTFGLRKSSILSALFNSIILLVAVGIILWEAVHRLMNPSAINSKIVIIVAMIGIVINASTALLFFKDKNDDINVKGAYLHMVADALISFGVVLSTIIISYTAWNWLDPVISILISFVIIYGTWDIFKESIYLSLDAVPTSIDPISVRKYLETIHNVQDVHDLHIWSMSTTENALSVHLTMKDKILDNQNLVKITKDLKDQFRIHHPTIQFESLDENFHCAFKPEDVI